MWTWILFGVAFLLIIIAFLIKEALVRKIVNSKGQVIDTGMFAGWGIFVFFLNLIAFILIIIGIGFVIAYSKTVPWWVWLLLGLAMLFSFLGNLIASFGGFVFPLIFGFIALVLFIVGIIFYIIYVKVPWWIWVIIAIAIIFAILANIFESLSQKDVAVVVCADPAINCSPVVTIADPTTKTKVTTVNVAALPTANIPEQSV
ncbi:Hypothetical protein HVR_LOCUS655 [uncultured virus]|nr:Hypothetical protein HVR_LOCUS655 [uncultured virus]